VSADRLAPGWLADQLPRVLSDDHFTRRLLQIFEDVADSVRRSVVAFEHDLDVALAPMEFVRWIGGWLALTAPESLPEVRQRRLIANAGATWRRRGTKAAVGGLLETVTGATVEIDDGGGIFDDGAAPPNRRSVVVRLESRGGLTDEQLLDLLRLEVPAHATVELEVTGDAPPPRSAEEPSEEPVEEPVEEPPEDEA
jgi:phage tail-like protein